jgi:membrane-bound lytic murein transglycosylase D
MSVRIKPSLRLSFPMAALFALAACSHPPARMRPSLHIQEPWEYQTAPARMTPSIHIQEPWERQPSHFRTNSTKTGRYAYADEFPTPPELEPAVNFWRKTYALWRRSQVAIHDDRYLDLVYEVIDLPGPVADSLTAEQKELVSERRNYWKDQLSALEAKLATGGALNNTDRRLAAMLESQGRLQIILPGAGDRVHSQRGMLERFRKGMEISARYEQTFRRIFREEGLPEDLAYLPHVESSFQASAQSSAGAVGIWQFTRGAAEKFMTVNGAVDERYDPIASTYGAARYLRYAYSKLGDWPTALTSYNHGINGMRRAQNQVGNDFVRIVQQYDSPTFGFASRNYYAEFLAAREIARNPEQFFAEAAN